MLRLPLVSVACLFAFATLVAAARADTTVCKLDFSMRGYSKNFEQSNGRGTVRCDNGQSATVAILGRGASLRDGSGGFSSGTATFSPVLDISAVLGSYVLPPAARVGNQRPKGVAGAMSNGQATVTFPLTGPSANMAEMFGRIGIIAHSLSY